MTTVAFSSDDSVRRLAECLGLERCRKATLRLEAGAVVTIATEQFAAKDQIDKLSHEITTGRYVVITKDEYDRLNYGPKTWIAAAGSVKEVGERVLVRSPGGYVSIAAYLPDGTWVGDDGEPANVYEWKPLPHARREVTP